MDIILYYTFLCILYQTFEKSKNPNPIKDRQLIELINCFMKKLGKIVTFKKSCDLLDTSLYFSYNIAHTKISKTKLSKNVSISVIFQ